MRPREWTPEEIEWLKENYPIKTDHSCRMHLHISYERLYEKAEELGLKKIVLKPSAVKTSKDRKVLWIDENACGSYCQDCIRYHKGKCEKTGKEVGALWQKKCFRGEE